jgi:hypothetical protein|tara:strand:- start:1468 stop:1938 length:471 start_codon:yes stop_codon:yes gene_type:complete
MSKFMQGSFDVANPQKFIGGKAPYYRSSWELAFMRMCDSHPNITKWASENVKIPYQNPVTGRYANYVPDFMIQYTDKDGSQHVELIEIKPANQTTLENARSQGQKIATVVNAAKWTAAQEWCKRKGIRFKVINEDQIFSNKKPRKAKQRISKKRVK